MRAIIIGIVSLLLITAPAAAEISCPADQTGDGVVNVPDMLVVLTNFGGFGPEGDINGDGIVNIVDLFEVFSNWGPCLYDYSGAFSNPEAEQIALEMLGPTGPLQPSVATYLRVEDDLEAIRAFEPSLADQVHTPAWLPNHLIVKLLFDVPTDGYECLNQYLQVTGITELFSTGDGVWLVLEYPGNLNVVHLAVDYAALDEIQFAEPDFLIGGQNFYTPTHIGGGTWSWHVDDGWLDCFDGCDCHREWIFDVDSGGDVVLVDVEEWGAPWCEF